MQQLFAAREAQYRAWFAEEKMNGLWWDTFSQRVKNSAPGQYPPLLVMLDVNGVLRDKIMSIPGYYTNQVVFLPHRAILPPWLVFGTFTTRPETEVAGESSPDWHAQDWMHVLVLDETHQAHWFFVSAQLCDGKRDIYTILPALPGYPPPAEEGHRILEKLYATQPLFAVVRDTSTASPAPSAR